MSRFDQIDFRNIAPRNGSQRDAFEEFCCQIARRCSEIPEGSRYFRFRGSGGDGGVECIWKLPNEEEWGWQAKYIFDLKRAKVDLEDSITTAIRIHPQLTHYTICLPFDLTGPTGRKGKSQTQYFEEYRTKWESQARTSNVNMRIILSTPSLLLDDLLSFDPNGGRLRFWFDYTILSDEWFRNHLQEAKESAWPRYTPKLRIGTSIADSFEAFGLTDEWFSSLMGLKKSFKEILDRWEKAVASTTDEGWGVAFPEQIRPDGEKALNILKQINDEFLRIIEARDLSVDISSLAKMTQKSLQLFQEIRISLAEDLESKHGKGVADSVQFRQWNAEYMVSFPAANVDAADEVIQNLEQFKEWISSPSTRLINVSEFLLLGFAGVGKTHSICDIAEMRFKRELKTIVLFGERFSSVIEPWEQIRQQLGLDDSFSRDTLLSALDSAGEASGYPLLLCIDGVNETKPRTFWSNHLFAMISNIRRYYWIRLCVSCRTTYQSQVIPNIPNLIEVYHEGFKGIEFDACREFFKYYNFEPPVAAILQPEFSNPLFLRLVCEAMSAAGFSKLPSGWHGINTAINAFIYEKNKSYALQYDTHLSNRFPEKALKAFIVKAEESQRSSLPWSEASNAIESVLPMAQRDGLLIDWLVREGLLIVDAPSDTNSNLEDQVRVAFERLGEHLLVGKFLDNYENKNIMEAFNKDGQLGFTISDINAINEHKGLIEAITIQVPERFGIELPDCINNPKIQDQLFKIVVETLPWRDPNFITSRTSEIVNRALHLREFAPTVFDSVLTISANQSMIDSFWLHGVLSSLPMSNRDAFWCGYLHKKYEDNGPVKKLIHAAFEVEITSIPFEMVERWAISLLWFCAAADRRVRDSATKALVRMTESMPQIWDKLIKQFSHIDDEYIIERCLAATYGALLRSRNKPAENQISKIIFDEIFNDSSRFQNALIRDHARSILELAAFDGVLPEEINETDYLPPYKSGWPLKIPDVKEIEKYKDSHQDMPKLYFSCTYDDFNKYTLSRLSSYENSIDREGMAHWIFQHVLELGYPNDGIVGYDGYMVTNYGGGRGKPNWAERIGKKYQWIALARLTAHIIDNLKPKRNSWYEEPIRQPLAYDDGRDLDPSLIIKRSKQNRKSTSWWFPEKYDFENTSEMSDEDWTNIHNDIPDSANMLSERIDKMGNRWIILEIYPEWSARTPEMDYSSRYRLIWLQIRSYLLSIDEVDKCWEWMQQQNFFGRWMPGGAEFHRGFVGEYPWGTIFNLYEDSHFGRGGFDDKEPPCEMYPTCNSLSSNYEYDSFQEEGINFLLPAKRFFKFEELHWNGTSGYLSNNGNLRFIDPSIREAGPSALLVESDFLKNFLSKHNLAIAWTIIGEKLIIGDNSAPRLVYSRGHIFSNDGMLSSAPVITHD